MKYWCIFIIINFPFVLFAQTAAPELNDSGLASTIFNPASLRLNDQTKWSANILSFNFWASSNSASLSLIKLFSTKDLLRQNILGTSRISSGNAGLDVMSPAVGIRIDNKTNISFITRSRTLSNFSNINGRLISEIGEIVDEAHQYPYPIRATDNMLINTAVFNDLTFNITRNLRINNHHKIRGGISVKYLNGAAHSSIEISQLSGVIKINKDHVSFLSDASGQVSTQTSGSLLSHFNLGNLIKSRKAGIGADIGFIYDFVDHPLQKHPRLSVGISVSDIGKIRYKPDSIYSKSYKIEIPAEKGLYFNDNFNNSSFSQTSKIYDKYPYFFKQTSFSQKVYTIGLPAMLRLKVNYRFAKEFSAVSDAGLNLTKQQQPDHLQYSSFFSLTSCWSRNYLSLSLPVSYQQYAGFNIGAAARYKRFYIGSNSLLSLGIGSRQIDAYIGILLSPHELN